MVLISTRYLQQFVPKKEKNKPKNQVCYAMIPHKILNYWFSDFSFTCAMRLSFAPNLKILGQREPYRFWWVSQDGKSMTFFFIFFYCIVVQSEADLVLQKVVEICFFLCCSVGNRSFRPRPVREWVATLDLGYVNRFFLQNSPMAIFNHILDCPWGTHDVLATGNQNLKMANATFSKYRQFN